MATELPTDFEDAADTDQPVVENGRDENGVPYCAKHHCRMTIASSGKKGSRVAYYKCPVDGCEEKEKKIKTQVESSIPREPQMCGHCKDVVMERDEHRSDAAKTILKCPECQHRIGPFPRPELVAMHAHRRRPRMQSADVGDR